jgi:hypothetical protein
MKKALITPIISSSEPIKPNDDDQYKAVFGLKRALTIDSCGGKLILVL